MTILITLCFKCASEKSLQGYTLHLTLYPNNN